ncbi:response regulator [bacterium]|nr:response regulator [bacterium]
MQRLLLVDNDESFRSVYASALTTEGFFIDHAVDTAQALEKLKGGGFDAVICEILLPGRNGVRLIQDIRLQPKTLSLPIFLLTTLEAADVGIPVSLAQSLGVRAYLVKQQTSPSQLVRALRALLPAQ